MPRAIACNRTCYNFPTLPIRFEPPVHLYVIKTKGLLKDLTCSVALSSPPVLVVELGEEADPSQF